MMGWMALWEVAKVEGLPYCPDKPDQMEVLYGIVDGLDSKAHPKPRLAAAGHKASPRANNNLFREQTLLFVSGL
eukprot:10914275-Lingulodinium_polyedra.AAC.1